MAPDTNAQQPDELPHGDPEGEQGEHSPARSSAAPKTAPEPEVTSSAAPKSDPELEGEGVEKATDDQLRQRMKDLREDAEELRSIREEARFPRARSPQELRRILHARIENDFRHHPPSGPRQTQVYTRIRAQARRLAHELVELCPPSRSLSSALTRLEECVFHANAAVARDD